MSKTSAVVHILVVMWLGLFLTFGFPTYRAGELDFFSIWDIPNQSTRIIMAVVHIALIGVVISHFIHEEKKSRNG